MRTCDRGAQKVHTGSITVQATATTVAKTSGRLVTEARRGSQGKSIAPCDQ